MIFTESNSESSPSSIRGSDLRPSEFSTEVLFPVRNLLLTNRVADRLSHDTLYRSLVALSQALKVALRMPELFLSGTLDVLTPGVSQSSALTREQIACLLVHMFFKTPSWNKH